MAEQEGKIVGKGEQYNMRASIIDGSVEPVKSAVFDMPSPVYHQPKGLETTEKVTRLTLDGTEVVDIVILHPVPFDKEASVAKFKQKGREEIK